MRCSVAARAWAQNIHKNTDVVLKQHVGPNREALQLYRDILRTCRGFYWNDVDGSNWGDKLALSARDEFEQARYERDPLLIARMLVVGREALMNVQNKAAHANSAMVANVDNTRTDRAGSVSPDQVLRSSAQKNNR